MPKVNMKSASAGAQYQHHYRPLSILSLDFGEIVPARVIETVKSDKWNNVKGNGFMRVAPADFPAYGRSYLKSVSFFIPTYQLIEYADAFYQGQQLWHGKPVVKPGISTNVIVDIFNPAASQSLPLTTLVKEVQFGNTADFPAENEFDLVIPQNHSGSSPYWHFLRLTSLGRRYYKLLCGLGYDFRGFNTGSTVDDVRSTGNIVVDALPIVAYLKMYADYFLNIHMYNSSPLVQCLQHIREGNTFLLPGSSSEYVYNSDFLITSKGLRWLLDQVLLPWQSNMYLNAWNTMNDPIGVNGVNTAEPNSDSPIAMRIQTQVADGMSFSPNSLSVDESGTFIEAHLPGTEDYNSFLANTAQANQTIYAFYQFVRRNKLFGSEAAKQAFARLGIKGNDFDSYFVRKLFEGSQEIDFAAVMSNANTVVPDSEQGSYLGSYAGAGLCSLDFNYNYQASDYGFIIHVAYLQIDALMLHGFDPMVLRKNYLDHWTPEFDGKAQRAIPLMEISQSKFPASESVQGRDDTPFGFTNLYEEYRNMRDLVIGDFRVGFAKNYVFARDYSFYRNGARDLLRPQTNRMQYFSRFGQNGEFSDPFMLSASNGDRFYLQIKWQIDAVRPILSEEQALDLNGSGDTTLNTDSSQV